MSRERRRREEEAAREWKGAYRPYDIVREATIAFGVVLALTLALTILFSSPDDPPSTIKQWSRSDPVDFVTTATTELDGSSTTGGYGPPYNHSSDGQHIGFIHLQKWLGVSHPIDTATDFVLAPVRSLTAQPALQSALSTYQAATSKTQTGWTSAYEKALGNASAKADGSISVKAGDYGPLPTIMGSLLTFAQSGGLDGALLTSRQFYQTDYTKPLLFMADGGVLSSRAQAEHLLGTQWGMMNETGSYPGQSWLWLYTFWYQIKPFSTSTNADILVMAIMGVLSLAFILVPFLPGLRDLPRRIPIYKLIWREHYRTLRAGR
ncbi:MAG: hypothetical protein DLM64_13750 [Solirubrobacterales bacterium]|nr:MAG: hypothetical protein DLM64_13750 [Solirubrobacterales bacterium]